MKNIFNSDFKVFFFKFINSLINRDSYGSATGCKNKLRSYPEKECLEIKYKMEDTFLQQTYSIQNTYTKIVAQ